MKVIIIGGGPAGLLAGISAGKNGNNVTIIEKMNTVGRKLLITGKGRCNITNEADVEEFINNTPGNGTFLYSALYTFTNQDLLKLLNDNGLETKVERGGRIFPASDKSSDVVETLRSIALKNNVRIVTDVRAEKILIENEKVVGLKTSNGEMKCDKIIIATGGKSYPLTGSTGDGYTLAKQLGHTIIDTIPSLIPIETYEIFDLMGLSLKNIEITIFDKTNKKKIYQDFGEMIFTHFGISGPVVLSGSSHLIRYMDIKKKLSNREIVFSIDLKPALNEEKLDARILRDFSEVKNKAFKNSLDELLPKKMIPVIIELSGINPDKKVNEITKEERNKLVQLLKKFELTVKGFRPIEEAIVTSGGVNVKEINPSTMESKLVKGVYFAGEVIDVDAYTGGFNLQIAFSTGYLAGLLQDK